MFETGHFATLWKKMADRLGLKTEFLGYAGPTSTCPKRRLAPRRAADMIEERLRQDTQHRSRPSASCTTRPRPA
jgi:alanine-glyoxylate transaminase/serine-glyoxylate transaminase/serine-pyruvate transaminase